MTSRENQKKELKQSALKKDKERRQPVARVHRRAASSEEAATIDRALDGLLADFILQVRAAGETDS